MPEPDADTAWRAKMEEWKPLLLIAARLLLVLGGVGGGAGLAVNTAEHEAETQATREKALAVDDRLELIRQGVLQRIDVEERERNEALAKVRERIAALEARGCR